MEAKGKDLIFINQVSGDGSSLGKPTKSLLFLEQDTNFQLRHLSITNETFIAYATNNTYIVKLKPIQKTLIEMRVEAIIDKNFKRYGDLDRDGIVKDVIELHKQDVLTAYSKGLKLMSDIKLPSDEADLMADEYYSENFE